MLLISRMVYCFVCILSANIEPWHLIFPLLKFTFIFLILILFYKLFVKPRLFKINRYSGDWKYTESGNISNVKIELYRDKTRNPSLVNLIVAQYRKQRSRSGGSGPVFSKDGFAKEDFASYRWIFRIYIQCLLKVEVLQ